MKSVLAILAAIAAVVLFAGVSTAPHNQVPGDTLVATNAAELVSATDVSNIVANVAVNLWDETKGVEWKFVMNDGNLYTIAVTNVNTKAEETK